MTAHIPHTVRSIWHYGAVHVRRHAPFALYAAASVAVAGWIVSVLARLT